MAIAKPTKEKPQYNLWQISAYMISLAWKEQKSVLAVCLCTAVLAVALNLAELFIAPAILSKVELASPLSELLITITLFTATLLILRALQAYTNANTRCGRFAIRFCVASMMHDKLATTSYSNTGNADFIKKLESSRTKVS